MDDATFMQCMRCFGYVSQPINDLADVIATGTGRNRNSRRPKTRPRRYGTGGVSANGLFSLSLSRDRSPHGIQPRNGFGPMVFGLPIVKGIQEAGEGHALDQLHGIEPLVFFGTGCEDSNEVRVLDPPKGSDLACETGLSFGITHAEQTLNRHLPSEGGLPGAVDDPHATLAQPAQ